MKKADDGLATIAFIVTMGGAVALAIASDIAAPACKAAAQVANEKFDFGCLEFWFNRYQSLLGNLITAGVAGIALFWAAGQLIAANKQATAANQQALISAAQALRDTIGDYQEIRKNLEQFGAGIGGWRHQAHGSPQPTKPIWPEFPGLIARAKAIQFNHTEVISPLESVQLQSVGGKIYPFTGRLGRMVSDIQVLVALIIQLDEGEKSPPDITLNQARNLLTEVEQRCETCIELNNEALTVVRQQVTDAWEIIRSFEERAIEGGRAVS
ncbi:hypothetical protein [Bosea sp. TAF32]|uniref:hypothetical protein n=1 Tax=Bosea sp. TAF32 TaxID=3237482 RepID=UPI003F8DB0A0